MTAVQRPGRGARSVGRVGGEMAAVQLRHRTVDPLDVLVRAPGSRRRRRRSSRTRPRRGPAGPAARPAPGAARPRRRTTTSAAGQLGGPVARRWPPPMQRTPSARAQATSCGVSPITIVSARGWGDAGRAGAPPGDRRRARPGPRRRSRTRPAPTRTPGRSRRALELQLRHALEVAGQQADDDVVARGQPRQQLASPRRSRGPRDRPGSASRRPRSTSGGRRRPARRSSPPRRRRRAGSPVRSRRRSARRWRTAALIRVASTP